ncbi:hypothetical protein M3Y94_00637100 [Aphelenchoides besseyi]|nr:hypothetical protein M3Y94_00637100 [Aphelenchoides besseyi]
MIRVLKRRHQFCDCYCGLRSNFFATLFSTMDSDMRFLLRDLGLQSLNPDERFYMKNVDKTFVQHNLNSELRGPTHGDIQLNVLNTWRIESPVNFPSDDKNFTIHLLLHGAPKKQIGHIVRNGFTEEQLSSKKRIFGSAYYFSACSTKEINLTVEGAGSFELRHDHGDIVPRNNTVVYLLYCEVGCQKLQKEEFRDKDLASDKNFPERMYMLLGRHENRKIENGISAYGQEVQVPRGPIEYDKTIIDNQMVDHRRPADYAEYCVVSNKWIRPVILAQIHVTY